MSIASFSGLASGIQWRDLLDQVILAETGKRITPLEQQAGLERQRITALNNFRGSVDKLGTAAKALRDGTAFGRFTVTGGESPTTGRTLLGATTTASAQPGSYSIEVRSLARAASMASATQAGSDQSLGLAGDFELNGTTIEIGADDTLADVRDRINAAGAGVTAGIMKVGPDDYRLTLTSDTTGSGGIGLAAGTLDLAAVLGLQTTVEGADARLRVNGIDVTRAGNTVSDLIDGVTLTLQGAEEGVELELRIARDEAALTDAVEEFVTAYNEIRSFVDQQTGASTQPLARSAVLRSSLNGFKDVLLADVTDPADGAFSRLGAIGLTLNRYGVLELDERKLEDAVTGNLDDVRRVLADAGTKMVAAAEQVTKPETGSVAVQVKSHNNTITSLDRRVEELRDRLDRQYERMERDFIRMESALLQIQSQGDWLANQIAAMQPRKQ